MLFYTVNGISTVWQICKGVCLCQLLYLLIVLHKLLLHLHGVFCEKHGNGEEQTEGEESVHDIQNVALYLTHCIIGYVCMSVDIEDDPEKTEKSGPEDFVGNILV